MCALSQLFQGRLKKNCNQKKKKSFFFSFFSGVNLFQPRMLCMLFIVHIDGWNTISCSMCMTLCTRRFNRKKKTSLRLARRPPRAPQERPFFKRRARLCLRAKPRMWMEMREAAAYNKTSIVYIHIYCIVKGTHNAAAVSRLRQRKDVLLL